MNTKSLNIIILGLIGLLVVTFYFTLKAKISDVSNDAAYASFINKKLTNKKAGILYLNLSEYKYFEDYYLDNAESIVPEGVQETYNIPVGTNIRINKIYSNVNGTSGVEHIIGIGSLFLKDKNKEIRFEYRIKDNALGLYSE